MDWREDTLQRLRRRNREQVEPFSDIILRHNRMLDKVGGLALENNSLTFVNQRLEDENRRLKEAGGGGADHSENIHELQKKMFSVQEELTELHRRKGENAQQVLISLRFFSYFYFFPNSFYYY